MNADGKSDESVVPSTRVNNAGTEPVAEPAEGRDSAKRNAEPSDLDRPPKRNERRSLGLAGVRMTARTQPELKFTSLLHHINESLLYEAFFDLKKTAAVGIDEVTWHDYEQDLENHIPDLHGRIHRGAYRAKPSKRIYIAKADGRKRPSSQHTAHDALSVGIADRRVNWVLDADVEGFFDNIDHEWLIKFLEHRVADNMRMTL